MISMQRIKSGYFVCLFYGYIKEFADEIVIIGNMLFSFENS